MNISNPALSGINLVETGITYGTVEIGGTSASKETSMGNVGNQIFDVLVEGDSMCTDFPTCSGNTISVVQQKWRHLSSAFDWDDAETGAGPYVLEDTANTGCTAGADCADTHGCMNRDIAVRNDHTTTTTNESVYWKLRIPASQKTGSYTGQNTFSTTADTTCAGGVSY